MSGMIRFAVISSAFWAASTGLASAAEFARLDAVRDADAVLKVLSDLREGFREHRSRSVGYRLKGVLNPEGTPFVMVKKGVQGAFDLQFDPAQHSQLYSRWRSAEPWPRLEMFFESSTLRASTNSITFWPQIR